MLRESAILILLLHVSSAWLQRPSGWIPADVEPTIEPTPRCKSDFKEWASVHAINYTTECLSTGPIGHGVRVASMKQCASMCLNTTLHNLSEASVWTSANVVYDTKASLCYCGDLSNSKRSTVGIDTMCRYVEMVIPLTCLFLSHSACQQAPNDACSATTSNCCVDTLYSGLRDAPERRRVWVFVGIALGATLLLVITCVTFRIIRQRKMATVAHQRSRRARREVELDLVKMVQMLQALPSPQRLSLGDDEENDVCCVCMDGSDEPHIPLSPEQQEMARIRAQLQPSSSDPFEVRSTPREHPGWAVLPCQHVLHRLCLERWVLTSARKGRPPTCPECRTVLPSDTDESSPQPAADGEATAPDAPDQAEDAGEVVDVQVSIAGDDDTNGEGIARHHSYFTVNTVPSDTPLTAATQDNGIDPVSPPSLTSDDNLH